MRDHYGGRAFCFPHRKALKAIVTATVCVASLSGIVLLDGCASASDNTAMGYGPNPTLPPPQTTLIPTLNVAPAKPWPEGMMPTAAAGFSVAAFAKGLCDTCRRPPSVNRQAVWMAKFFLVLSHIR